MKIINKWWFSEMGTMRPIGIVVGEDKITGERKAYIGTASGEDEDDDTNHISKCGAKLMPRSLEEILRALKK
jgi:hypothetical protein